METPSYNWPNLGVKKKSGRKECHWMKTKLKVCVVVELLDYDCIWDTSQQVQGKQRFIIIIEETKEKCLHPYVKEEFLKKNYFEDWSQHRWGPWGDSALWGQPISHQDVLLGQNSPWVVIAFSITHCTAVIHLLPRLYLRLHVIKMTSVPWWILLWLMDNIYVDLGIPICSIRWSLI